ncbi:abortive infection family protein [Brevundimonas sp. TWP2-3-2]|uniref:abortive infection family protein n=1 Tax=unclassified Brevundimonas TaxID=2622653 RepID=UPI003CE94A62
MTPQDLPAAGDERALVLQNLLIVHATGGIADEGVYSELRREFSSDPQTADLLPRFVRTCRDLASFWQWIKYEKGTYAERRTLIREAFEPLLDVLEGRNRAPLDASASETLASFDADGVHSIWEKALARRQMDPEGAITAARTLLETVCKHVIEEEGSSYNDKDDLPKLYGDASKLLNIAPSQHTEEVFKQILGGCISVVVGLGTLRNRVSDSHGQGKRAVKPAPRHAQLAVNLAGTMATFLIETWAAKRA